MGEMIFKIADDKKTLIIEREFKAEKNLLWQAFTTPEMFAKWWSPKGWSTTVKEMNFEVGGHVLYGMKCEDPAQKDWFGQESWGKSTYLDINPEDNFTYQDEFTDSEGNPTPAMPVSKTKQEFISLVDSVKLVSTTYFESEESLSQVIEMGMKEGIAQTWDKLSDLVEKK